MSWQWQEMQSLKGGDHVGIGTVERRDKEDKDKDKDKEKSRGRIQKSGDDKYRLALTLGREKS